MKVFVQRKICEEKKNLTEKERNKGYEKYLSEKRVGKKSRKNLKGRKMAKKKEEIIKKKKNYANIKNLR